MNGNGIDISVDEAAELPEDDQGSNDLPDLVLGENDFEDEVPPTQFQETMPDLEMDLESAQGAEEEEPVTLEPRTQHTYPHELFKDADPTVKTDLALAIPTLSLDDVVDLLQAAEGIAKTITRDQAHAIEVHALSAPLHPHDDVYDRFFKASQKITNHLKTPSGVTIGQSIPPYKEPVVGKVLDAADASAYLARLNKTFDHVYMFAIHSGMWLKVENPPLTDLHNLQGRMAGVRNQLGYETRGATLSCDTALRNMIFMDWLIERVTQTNMKDSDPAAIRRNLMATDIPLLAQQMASTIHPSGYLTERACSTKPGVCTHIEKAFLRLSKMIFTDTSRLTDKQHEHMQTQLRSNARKSDEDMAAYRNEFGKTTVRQVTLSPMAKVTFTPPSLELYAGTAEEWAGDIKKSSEGILSSMTEMEARQHLQEQARLGVLTKYAAWVESIDLQGRIVQDQSAIRKLLASMSEDDVMVERFTEGVSQYISDCTVAAVGVNDYVCPACKGKQASGSSGVTSSIAAIDPITAFFTLTQLKIQRSLSRGLVL